MGSSKYSLSCEVKDPQANIARASKSPRGLKSQLSLKFTVQERNGCNLLRKADLQESFWQLHLSRFPHPTLPCYTDSSFESYALFPQKTKIGKQKLSITLNVVLRIAVLSLFYVPVLLSPQHLREGCFNLGQTADRIPGGMCQLCGSPPRCPLGCACVGMVPRRNAHPLPPCAVQHHPLVRGRLRRSRGGAAPPSLPALSSRAEAASQNGAAPSRDAPGVKMAAEASPSLPVPSLWRSGAMAAGSAVWLGDQVMARGRRWRWAPWGCGSLGCPWALTCVRPAGGAGAVPLRQPSPGAPGVAGEACGVLPPPQDGILRPGAGGMRLAGGPALWEELGGVNLVLQVAPMHGSPRGPQGRAAGWGRHGRHDEVGLLCCDQAVVSRRLRCTTPASSTKT